MRFCLIRMGCKFMWRRESSFSFLLFYLGDKKEFIFFLSLNSVFLLNYHLSSQTNTIK